MYRLTYSVKAVAKTDIMDRDGAGVFGPVYKQVLEILNHGFMHVPVHFRANDVPVAKKEHRELEERLVHRPYTVLDAGSHNFSSGFGPGRRETDEFCFVLKEEYVRTNAELLRVYASKQSREFLRLVKAYDIKPYSKKHDSVFEALFPMPDQVISLEQIPVSAIESLIMQLGTGRREIVGQRNDIYRLAVEKGITMLGYEPIQTRAPF